MRISERDSTIFLVFIFLVALTYLSVMTLQTLRDIRHSVNAEPTQPGLINLGALFNREKPKNGLVPPPPPF